jgi:uncharacterized protein
MSNSKPPLPAVAARYLAASNSGDDDQYRAVMTPNVELWHANDLVNQTVEQNLKVSKWLRRKIPDLRIENVRQTPTADGFVQRHVMTGTGPDGKTFELYSCLVVDVGPDGLISRSEEYFDTAQLPKLA